MVYRWFLFIEGVRSFLRAVLMVSGSRKRSRALVTIRSKAAERSWYRLWHIVPAKHFNSNDCSMANCSMANCSMAGTMIVPHCPCWTWLFYGKLFNSHRDKHRFPRHFSTAFSTARRLFAPQVQAFPEECKGILPELPCASDSHVKTPEDSVPTAMEMDQPINRFSALPGGVAWWPMTSMAWLEPLSSSMSWVAFFVFEKCLRSPLSQQLLAKTAHVFCSAKTSKQISAIPPLPFSYIVFGFAKKKKCLQHFARFRRAFFLTLGEVGTLVRPNGWQHSIARFTRFTWGVVHHWKVGEMMGKWWEHDGQMMGKWACEALDCWWD